MLVTVFVFLGVEGASVYSRHAERREDVGRATVLGFLMVFAVFASVTIVSYGILPQPARSPSCGSPRWAACSRRRTASGAKVFISVGLIISVLGAYLAWTLMAAEVLLVAAKDEDMPRFLGRVNAATDVPIAALLMTTILIQIVLLVHACSDDAFNFALDLTSALSLIPFVLAAAYALKLASDRGDVRRAAGRARAARAIVARWRHVLHAVPARRRRPEVHPRVFIIYAPATVLFVMARREQGRELFSPTRARHPRRLASSGRGWPAGRPLTAGWITHHEGARHDRNRCRHLRRALRGRHAAQGRGLRTRPGAQPTDPDQLRRPAVRRRDVGAERAARPLRLHDKMRERGVEVLELHNLLAETMDIPEAKAWLLDRKIIANQVGLGLVDGDPRLPRVARLARAGAAT